MTSDKVAPGQIDNNSQDPLVGLAIVDAPTSNNSIKDVEVQQVPVLVDFLSCPFLCGGFYVVEPRQAVANVHCGVLTAVEDEPGCHYAACCCLEQHWTELKQKTMEIPTAKVADGNANPINVSCIVNYRIVDPKKAIMNVENLTQYVNTNAQAVLKQTVSHYTYNQLKGEYSHINEQMKSQLQPLVDIAGVEVASMSLNDLSYASEVAAAMLKKQQAAALIEARTLIVEGACRIAQDAILKLEQESDLNLSDEAKVRIVTNLLTVTCSEGEAVPTLGLS